MLSNRVKQIKPSPTLAITAKAKAMRAEGIDVVGFGAGEPDFDTPDHVKEAALEAIRAGFTKYTASGGIPELKRAIIDKLKRDSSLAYEPGEILVSVGGKHSFYNLAQAITGPVLAAAVNSPLLLGNRLWHETRVALFEHSVDHRSRTHRSRGQRARVRFGERWADHSVLEIFRDDIARFLHETRRGRLGHRDVRHRVVDAHRRRVVVCDLIAVVVGEDRGDGILMVGT